jgi:hypothetical protein
LRTLAAQWGGDSSAAAINATIQGIIPTVARGIFQEVGVLTDQDIENYKRTVPDINKPDAANKLIELVLTKTLERAYADTLITAAQNQTNVSNFADEYENIRSRIDTLSGAPSKESKAFVEKTLTAKGLNYDSLVAEMRPQAPAGTQPALDKATGQPVFATEKEIASGKYVAL